MRTLWARCYRLIRLAPALITLGAMNVQADALDDRLMSATTDGIIMPAYQRLVSHTDALQQQSQAFCQGQVAQKNLQQSWLEAMKAWSYIAPVNVGPISQGNQAWRLQFWPDKKNLVQRQLKSLLKQPAESISAPQLAEKSIAIQGLNAVEFLLFDQYPGGLKPGNTACALLQAMSVNIHQAAVAVYDGWRLSFREQWLDKELNRNGSHINRLYTAAVTSLDVVKGRKLGEPLGMKDGSLSQNSNPWFLEAWRSRQSLALLGAVIQFNRDLYEHEQGLGAYLLNRSPESTELDAQIRQQFATLQATLNKMSHSLLDQIQSGQTADAVALYKQLEPLVKWLSVDFPRASGLQIGFNSNDGD